MSEPVIPQRTQEEALVDLLESIALEETALAHIINAEGEKIQAIAKKLEEGTIEPAEAIEFQKVINKILRTPIKQQMLLQFKLEDVLEAKTSTTATTSTTSTTTTTTTA